MSKDKDYADKIAMSTGKFVEGILKELTLDFPQDITFSGRYIAGDIHVNIEATGSKEIKKQSIKITRLSEEKVLTNRDGYTTVYKEGCVLLKISDGEICLRHTGSLPLSSVGLCQKDIIDIIHEVFESEKKRIASEWTQYIESHKDCTDDS